MLFLFKRFRGVEPYFHLVQINESHHVCTPETNALAMYCAGRRNAHSNKSSCSGISSSPCRYKSGMKRCSWTRRVEYCSCSAEHKDAKTLIISFASSCLLFSMQKTTARRCVNRKDVAHLKTRWNNLISGIAADAYKHMNSQNSVSLGSVMNMVCEKSPKSETRGWMRRQV